MSLRRWRVPRRWWVGVGVMGRVRSRGRIVWCMGVSRLLTLSLRHRVAIRRVRIWRGWMKSCVLRVSWGLRSWCRLWMDTVGWGTRWCTMRRASRRVRTTRLFSFLRLLLWISQRPHRRRIWLSRRHGKRTRRMHLLRRRIWWRCMRRVIWNGCLHSWGLG